jgi:hypothetical protein
MPARITVRRVEVIMIGDNDDDDIDIDDDADGEVGARI